MTIALTGAGSLFVRLGHIFAPPRDLLSLMGGTATTLIATGTRFNVRHNTIDTDLYAGTALPITAANATYAPYTALSAFQGAQSNYFQWASGLAKAVLSAMVSLDQGLAENPGLSQNFTIPYLLNQMFFASSGSYAAPTATLQSCTLSLGAQTAGLAGVTGNPIIVLGNKNVLGQILQLVFPETVTFTCTRDAQGGAAAGNETLSYAGYPAASGPFSQQYPAGSGCSEQLFLVDGSKSNSTGNALQNPAFTAVTTGNIPDNWTLVIGAAGTDIFVGAATGYKTGSNSLKFTGTGGALQDEVKQNFNTTPNSAVGAGGTSFALVADTTYCFNAWIKVSATPTNGTLKVSLQDGAGNILNDDTGTANSATFNMNAGNLNVSTTYVNINCIFRTPANMTTQAVPFALDIALSVAIDSGKTVFIANPSLTPMTQLYAGGPPAAAFSGSINPVDGITPDVWTSAITNTYGQVQMWMDRVFGIRALGLQFPYSGSPSIADSLIV